VTGSLAHCPKILVSVVFRSAQKIFRKILVDFTKLYLVVRRLKVAKD
jgi:hypothetical protein